MEQGDTLLVTKVNNSPGSYAEVKKTWVRNFSLPYFFNTLRTGDADLRFLHYNCTRRMMKICFF